MDPILSAITAALAAAASTGMTEVGKKAITDAYEGLKSLLVKKLASKPTATEALEKFLDVPDSPALGERLSKVLAAEGFGRDSEIQKAVQQLQDRIRHQGVSFVSVIAKDHSSVAIGGGDATVSYSRSGKPS